MVANGLAGVNAYAAFRPRSGGVSGASGHAGVAADAKESPPCADSLRRANIVQIWPGRGEDRRSAALIMDYSRDTPLPGSREMVHHGRSPVSRRRSRIVGGGGEVIVSGSGGARAVAQNGLPVSVFSSEAALVEAAKALDGDAWTQIYAQHYERIYAYLYYRIGRREVAEDLAADVFVRALAGIRTFAYRGTPLLAWLFRIAHNVAADYRKTSARQALNVAPGADMDAAVGADDVTDQVDRRQDMRAALSQLTDDQQQVLFLRFYQGMSNAEVGAVIGKREGAVKALQNRALKSLRRAMDAQEGKRRRA